ncbi:MAG: phosphomannomutase [Methanobacterium sp.]
MSKYVQDIRGKVNLEITNKFATQIGALIGNYIGAGKSVMVGRDSNTPSQMIKRSLSTGLMSAGIKVIDFGVAPIPVIHYGMNRYGAKVMVTISESHLRPEDIVIKIFSPHEIPLEQRHIEKVPWNQIVRLKYVQDYTDKYISSVINHITSDLIESKGFRIVVDCEKGLKNPIIPKVLNKMGCETVSVGCKEIKERNFPEPSPQRLSLVSDITTSIGADMGVVLDNDHDGVEFIDEKGNIIRHQTILAIFAKFLLEENPGNNVVSSVVASKVLDKIVSNYNGKFIKTSVNSVLTETVNNKAIFGGDEPGMYIFPQFQKCFDAVYSVSKMLEILAAKNTTLSCLAAEIPEYSRSVFTVNCEQEKKMKVLDAIKTYYESKSYLSTVDGVRVELNDYFILIRPSRFEPLIRVYIESKSSESLQRLTKSVTNIIESV